MAEDEVPSSQKQHIEIRFKEQPSDRIVGSKQDRQQKSAEEQKTEDDKKAIENEKSVREIIEREKYARRIFRLIVVWLAFVGIIIVADGIHNPVFGFLFDLSDAVLITLITTTTASVLGLFIVVVNYLFHRPSAGTKSNTDNG